MFKISSTHQPLLGRKQIHKHKSNRTKRKIRGSNKIQLISQSSTTRKQDFILRAPIQSFLTSFIPGLEVIFLLYPYMVMVILLYLLLKCQNACSGLRLDRIALKGKYFHCILVSFLQSCSLICELTINVHRQKE